MPKFFPYVQVDSQIIGDYHKNKPVMLAGLTMTWGRDPGGLEQNEATTLQGSILFDPKKPTVLNKLLQNLTPGKLVTITADYKHSVFTGYLTEISYNYDVINFVAVSIDTVLEKEIEIEAPQERAQARIDRILNMVNSEIRRVELADYGTGINYVPGRRPPNLLLGATDIRSTARAALDRIAQQIGATWVSYRVNDYFAIAFDSLAFRHAGRGSVTGEKTNSLLYASDFDRNLNVSTSIYRVPQKMRFISLNPSYLDKEGNPTSQEMLISWGTPTPWVRPMRLDTGIVYESLAMGLDLPNYFRQIFSNSPYASTTLHTTSKRISEYANTCLLTDHIRAGFCFELRKLLPQYQQLSSLCLEGGTYVWTGKNWDYTLKVSQVPTRMWDGMGAPLSNRTWANNGRTWQKYATSWKDS